MLSKRQTDHHPISVAPPNKNRYNKEGPTLKDNQHSTMSSKAPVLDLLYCETTTGKRAQSVAGPRLWVDTVFDAVYINTIDKKYYFICSHQTA